MPSSRLSGATESKEGHKVNPIDSLGKIQELLDQSDDQIGQNSQHYDQKTLLLLVGLGVFTLVISYDETFLLQTVFLSSIHQTVFLLTPDRKCG